MLTIAWQNHPFILAHRPEVTKQLIPYFEIEHILLPNKKNADIAVSFFEVEKDAPNIEELIVLKRDGLRSVLIALAEQVHLENFTRSFHFATDSICTQAYLLHFFPQNVAKVTLLPTCDTTAFERLQAHEFDGIFTQQCIAQSLNWSNFIVQKMNLFAFLPQIGAATIKIQCDNLSVKTIAKNLFHHLPSYHTLKAEVSFYQNLHTHINAPIFAYCNHFQDILSLTGGCISPEKNLFIQQKLDDNANNAAQLGKALADEIVSQLF